MISVSVCLSSQPDTAVQPAKELNSYTTSWDTIDAEAFRRLKPCRSFVNCLYHTLAQIR